MNQLPPDLLFETLRNTPLKDIGKWCTINKQFDAICRSPRGQALIRRLKEENVDRFLDFLNTNGTMLGTFLSEMEERELIPQELYTQRSKRQLEVLEQVVLDFLQEHPEIYPQILTRLNIPIRSNVDPLDQILDEMSSSGGIYQVVNFLPQPFRSQLITRIGIVYRQFDKDFLVNNIEILFQLQNYLKRQYGHINMFKDFYF